jgi:hypothetical protein
MLNDYHTLTIATHFISALVNDDYSGIDIGEARQLDDFMVDYWKLPNATIDVIEPENHFFAEDDITGAYADCLQVRVYFTNDYINEARAYK